MNRFRCVAFYIETGKLCEKLAVYMWEGNTYCKEHGQENIKDVFKEMAKEGNIF